MVNNISNTQRQNARPQRGIGSADLLIESKVEGGISRFCAVYYDANAIPEVGPLRSGRDQFLQLLMPWQALYYHDGESAPCTKFINVYNYSGLNIGGKSYFNTPTIPMWRTATVAAATWLTSTPNLPPVPRSGKLPPTRVSGCNTLMRAPSSALRTTAPAQRTRCPALPPPRPSTSCTRTATRLPSATTAGITFIKCPCTAAPPVPLKTPWTS